MRERQNNTAVIAHSAWRRVLQQLRWAVASRPAWTSATGYRVALAAVMLAVFLVSVVAVTFDNHDFARLKPQCSICEGKKLYKASSKKAFEDAVFFPSSLWGDGERFHGYLLAPSTEHAQPLSLPFFRETDRAPPFLS